MIPYKTHSELDAAIQNAINLIRLQCYTNTVYFIDEIKYENPRTFIRLKIDLNTDGFYVIEKLKVYLDASVPTCHSSRLGHFRYLPLAMEQLDQNVTAIEQQNFSCFNEVSKKTVSLRNDSEKLNEFRIINKESNNFVSSNIYSKVCIQALPSGIHSFLLIDSFGVPWIRSVGCKNKREWQKISKSNINSSILKATHIDGFTGAIFEGFYNGYSFSILDIVYLHDCWTYHLHTQERLQILMNYFKTQGLNISHIIPCMFVTLKEAWSFIKNQPKAYVLSFDKSPSSLSIEFREHKSKLLISNEKSCEVIVGKSHNQDQLQIISSDTLEHLKYSNLKCDLDIANLSYQLITHETGDTLL